MVRAAGCGLVGAVGVLGLCPSQLALCACSSGFAPRGSGFAPRGSGYALAAGNTNCTP
jgi:hypothetical protein